MTKKKNNLITPVNIGIVGYGIVGQALAYCFSISEVKGNYNISFYDKYKKSAPLASVQKWFQTFGV
ncbi:MAG: hypothetical protein COV57_00195 [Candidatus Liptonbacteria bacterium CG11_big_fil_rev_8_21_14_0_20_35_14]|uniref:Uncharacterized protein n=1 Tax=Candidatus Liptonbacteria bacterium CG11_big_fil_rev_8_21_14_0_20_35_14 TaxID=1974634 RepID=A0A2H0N8M8_9BACT|nr:MAG: hypothetical protein COV57_00195 [Candidatus Liptonbacteria bacterium CG11_big_fil_rev_8_21_14_0_20_35_14]